MICAAIYARVSTARQAERDLVTRVLADPSRLTLSASRPMKFGMFRLFASSLGTRPKASNDRQKAVRSCGDRRFELVRGPAFLGRAARARAEPQHI